MDQDTAKQQTRGIFDRAARTYDTVGPRFFTYFAEQLVEAARPAPGSLVLDIATGSGTILRAAAEAVGPSGRVIGIDLAPQMVRRASDAVRSLGNGRTLVMDGENLAFADASFDCVFCGFAVFFFPNYAKGLAEMRRVLKPGGKLVLSTWGPRDERFSWIPDVLAAHAPPSAPQQTRVTRVTNGPTWETPEGVTAALSEAGFAQIHIDQVAKETYYRDEQEWLDVQWSHGARAWLEPLPEPALAAVTADMFARLRQLQTADGIPQRQIAVLALAEKPRQLP